MKHAERHENTRLPQRDKPHPATRYDAGSGQGTVSGPPYGEATQDRPVLDGSTMSPEAERAVDNPWRGIYDPELRRHPAHEPDRAAEPIEQ